MPIFLDNLAASAATTKIYSPKFFDNKLTGSGKNIGVLNENVNPAKIGPLVTTVENRQARRKKYTNGNTDVRSIPVNPIGYNAWRYMDILNRPDTTSPDMVCVAEVTLPNMPCASQFYFQMLPHSIVMEETELPKTGQNQKSRIKRDIKPCYQTFLYMVNNSQYTEHICTETVFETIQTAMGKSVPTTQVCGHPINNPSTNLYITDFTCNPIEWVNSAIKDIQQYTSNIATAACTIHQDELDKFVQNYSLYDAMCERSEEWQTTIDTVLLQYFQNVKANFVNDNVALNEVARTLTYLENYPVPLNLYRKIYQNITASFPKDKAATLCKQNLSLLLSDTLNNLDKNKTAINGVPALAPGVAVPASVQKLSKEQADAVTSQEPLILVQSGAGTGKAHPLHTPILTPTGWTTIGELNVGDLVIGSDGLSHTVLRIHERGLRPGYHLTFSDSSQIDACGEHLWTVCMVERNTKRSDTITTDEWIQNRKYKNYAFLPTIRPVEYAFNEKDLPIDPYFLGALLANGNLDKDTIRYTESEKSVINQVKTAAKNNGYNMQDCTGETSTAGQWRFSHPEDQVNVSILKNRIRDLGLTVESHDKFIPDIYKTASVLQRKHLLNGLFDNCGDIRTGRDYARFNTSSSQLADDVLQLLWSLGLSAVKQPQKHGTDEYWSVNLLDGSWNPFIASSFADKVTSTPRTVRRKLKSAEPFDPVPMRCIEIDAPDHLYVAKDFIVTHNSTTILSRVDYMIAAGINPEDIMVLSFTNAAADHIKEKNPNIHSMTIAKMVHTIYAQNFPNHELSTLDTIINSLEIYYPDDDLAKRFKRKCIDVNDNAPGAFIQINAFIEMHYDDVMAMLDTIRQTSLELEIIICYQQIDFLTEPKEVQSKYLIIDEVQDNSVFEFVYTLRYVRKHNESLFIVGDCSQTLFEFRGSEPRALNVMEGSGTFSTYQLQVNYRSNQEILDFANVLLRDIEANQYAQIQLQANTLSPVTEQSFTNKVQLAYFRVQKQADFPDMLPTIFANTLKPYLDQKLAAGEKVAFLAHKRRMVDLLEEHLEKLYPNAKIVNMIPEKSYNSTIMSAFIQNYWDSVKFIPTQNIADMIGNLAIIHAENLIRNKVGQAKAVDIVATAMAKWKAQYKQHIDSWVRAYTSGVCKLDQLMENIKSCMLNFEIDTNAMKQRIVSMRNEEAKRNQDIKNANFLMSTIHSAKGLEFDNVVVLYDQGNQIDEPDKRMYYVAFTRAMKSEFILAYGPLVNPRIKTDYEVIVNKLHTANAQPAANAPVAATPAPAATASTNTPPANAPQTAPQSTTSQNYNMPAVPAMTVPQPQTAMPITTTDPKPEPAKPAMAVPDDDIIKALSDFGYNFAEPAQNTTPPDTTGGTNPDEQTD